MSSRHRGKIKKKIRKEKHTQGKACNLDTALLGERICVQKNINHSEETELKCTSHSAYLTEELDLPEQNPRKQNQSTSCIWQQLTRGFRADGKRDLV